MPVTNIDVVILVEGPGFNSVVEHNISSLATIEQLIAEILVRIKASGPFSSWELVFQNRVLTYETSVGSISRGYAVGKLTLTLRQAVLDEDAEPTVKAKGKKSLDQEIFETNFDVPALDDGDDLAFDDAELANEEEGGSRVVALDEELAEFQSDAAAVDDVEADAKSMPQRPNAIKRHATVRYYNRMNPETVYPLLVMVTKQMVEKVTKADTDQKSSGPFQARLDLPLEIEPIIPGCTCYPAIISTGSRLKTAASF